MKSVKILAIGLMVAASVANAGMSSTLTAASDYSLRGISQNAKSPVLQATIDVARDNGLYLGAFISSVSFDGQRRGTEYFSLERDIYGGYKFKFTESVLVDFGGKYYTYNSNDFNHGEIYSSITYNSNWKASAYYSPNFVNGDDALTSKPAFGFALDASKAMPADFSLFAHLGYNTGKYWKETSPNRSNYLDYSVGAGYKMGKLDWALQYVNTNATFLKGNRISSDEMNNEKRIILSATTSFAW